MTTAKTGYLIPPSLKAEFGQAVLGWMDQTLALYSPDNVARNGHVWTARNDRPDPFTWDRGAVLDIRPAPPTIALIVCKGDFRRARKRIYEIGLRLLEEARVKDRQQLRQRMKQEGL